MAQHFPELADKKEFRSIKQKIYIEELIIKNNGCTEEAANMNRSLFLDDWNITEYYIPIGHREQNFGQHYHSIL